MTDQKDTTPYEPLDEYYQITDEYDLYFSSRRGKRFNGISGRPIAARSMQEAMAKLAALYDTGNAEAVVGDYYFRHSVASGLRALRRDDLSYHAHAEEQGWITDEYVQGINDEDLPKGNDVLREEKMLIKVMRAWTRDGDTRQLLQEQGWDRTLDIVQTLVGRHGHDGMMEALPSLLGEDREEPVEELLA